MDQSTDTVAPDAAATVRHLRELRSHLTCSDDDLVERYWQAHPRFRFVKSAPPAAALLDIGAGSGGLVQWKSWGEPRRADLRFHGVDVARGEHAGLYRRWESLDLDRHLPRFRWVRFDACVMSHVIEHLRDPLALLCWLGRRMRRGARLYIEWPGPASLRQPRREAMLPLGIDIMITNFFDDASHVAAVSRGDLLGWLAAAGFAVVDSGTIDAGAIGEEMLVRGLRDGDGFKALCGFWSVTGWADWLIARAA